MDDTAQATAEAPESQQAAAQVARSIETDGGRNTTETENTAGDVRSRISQVSTPEDLERFRAELLNGGKARAESAESAAETQPDQVKAPTAPEPESTKPTETQKAANEEADESPLDPANLPDQFRLRLVKGDEVGRLAAALKHRNKDWTLEDCIADARKRLGKESVAPTKTTAETDAATEVPATTKSEPSPLEKLDAEIARLKAEKKDAYRNADLDRVSELDDELDTMRDKRDAAREEAREAKKAPKQPEKSPVAEPERELAAYNAAFDASLAKAAALYPFASQPDSPASKRMQEIDRELDANDDPLFRSPDKPLRIAQMVAAEMAIPPKSSVAKASTASPARPSAQKPLSPIASGASRTTTTRTESAPVVAAIRSLRTPEDLESFRSQMGATSR